MPFDGAPGTPKLVKAQATSRHIEENLASLQLACMGDPALGPIVDALRHAVLNENVVGLAAVEKAARRYLRVCRAPTTAPTRSEAIKILNQIAREGLKLRMNAFDMANHLRSQLEYMPDLVGRASLFAPGGFAPLRETIEKVMRGAPDSESIVVAALVGCGMLRKKARQIVQSAFRRD